MWVQRKDSSFNYSLLNCSPRPQLRDIFTLHTDTNCQTHDLLECSCADGEVVQPTENDELLYHSDGGMSSDSDDGNDSSGPDRRSFMKASQYQPSEEQEAKAQKKLQALKEYTHIDCGLSTAPESAIDGIEDDVLRVVAEAGLEALREGVSRKWNAARQYSPDDNDGEASTAVKAAYRGPTYEGGEISFVFHVSSSLMDAARLTMLTRGCTRRKRPTSPPRLRQKLR